MALPLRVSTVDQIDKNQTGESDGDDGDDRHCVCPFKTSVVRCQLYQRLRLLSTLEVESAGVQERHFEVVALHHHGSFCPAQQGQ